MSEFDKNTELAVRVAEKVREAGGCAYYVGGYVRDRILGIPNKDVDIEIHGIDPGRLERILETFGPVIRTGKSFGVLNIKGYDIDFAMPRKERCTGISHRDFDVDIDPYIGTEKAAERRDFTINSLMENVLTGEVIDHFGGRQDLQNHILRCVNSGTFREDPL